MTEILEHFFKENFTASDNEIADVVKYFKHKKVAKEEVLVESGETCRYMFFVVKGCIKASFIDPKGIETIRYVAFENQFISTIHSFIKQTPSSEYIVAIEESEVMAIAYSDFETALRKVALFKDFYIKMLEATYLHNEFNGKQYPCCASLTMGVIGGKWKTVILFHLMDGKLRYNELRKAMPTVTERTLSLQLKKLEEDGIVNRKVYTSKPPLKVEYTLTETGKTLIPIIKAIADWGETAGEVVSL